MPSSRRDGSEGKWMCPPFLTQARQPRHHFSVGLKDCPQQHLSPKPFIKKNNNLNGITRITPFLTIDVLGITSLMEWMCASDLQNNFLSKRGNGRDMRETWRVSGEITA